MKFTVKEFRAWNNKKITLLGMSGVGKTYISTILRQEQWFHYSGDYRIGTRYLDESILDMIKKQAMRDPFLKELLRNDWISIENNIKVHDLGPVLSYIGKLGNPKLGGIELEEFIKRQEKYKQAEIAAMYDVSQFIEKGQNIYGYQHFVNDVGGSLCELDDPNVIVDLAKKTLILYIQVTDKKEEEKLIKRSQSSPKPLYYRAEFLQEKLKEYLMENNIQFAAQMDPNDFTRWIFPKLFHARIPRYEAIAEPYGYTVSSQEISQVKSEKDFFNLLEKAIERKQ